MRRARSSALGCADSRKLNCLRLSASRRARQPVRAFRFAIFGGAGAFPFPVLGGIGSTLGSLFVHPSARMVSVPWSLVTLRSSAVAVSMTIVISPAPLGTLPSGYLDAGGGGTAV